jgi:hypothetical protein
VTIEVDLRPVLSRKSPEPEEIRDLVIRIADDNLSWGYSKICTAWYSHDALFG